MDNKKYNIQEVSLLVGSTIKIKLTEGYYTGIICKQPGDTIDEISIDEAVLDTMTGQHVRFPCSQTFKFSEIEDFELSSPTAALSARGENPRAQDNEKALTIDKHAEFLNEKCETTESNESLSVKKTVNRNRSTRELSSIYTVSNTVDAHSAIVKMRTFSMPENEQYNGEDEKDSNSYLSVLAKVDRLKVKSPPSSSNNSHVAEVTEKVQNIPLKKDHRTIKNKMDSIEASNSSSDNLKKNNLDSSSPVTSDNEATCHASKPLLECGFTFSNVCNEQASHLLFEPELYFFIESQNHFQEAINILKKESTLACGLDGIDLGANGVLCLIEIATSKYVFVFDVLSLLDDDFISEIRSIYEASHILKVTHDCRNAAAILSEQYGINLNNVYDVQVADVMIRLKEKKGDLPEYVKNLFQLIVYYLPVSEKRVQFYSDRKARHETNETVWARRPIEFPLLELAALNVRYLLDLHKETMRCMLSDFHRGVSIYLKSYRDNERMSSAELPEEFNVFQQSERRQNNLNNGVKPSHNNERDQTNNYVCNDCIKTSISNSGRLNFNQKEQNKNPLTQRNVQQLTNSSRRCAQQQQSRYFNENQKSSPNYSFIPSGMPISSISNTKSKMVNQYHRYGK